MNENGGKQNEGRYFRNGCSPTGGLSASVADAVCRRGECHFDGELLDRPCQIDPGSSNQTVQFLERPVKDFQYAPGGAGGEFQYPTGSV